MATPPFYDGSMATCEPFINACWIYIAAKPWEFGNIMAKVMWVLSYMQSRMAQQFRDAFLVYMQSAEYQTEFVQAPPTTNPIEILYQNLYQVFGDPNKQAMAILELMTMKQGTKTAEEHIQCFKQAYSCSGYQETAGIHELKRSLNTPLLNKCMSVPELPTTLEKWYKLQGSNQRNWQPQSQQWRPPAQSAQRDPNAMQVDHNRSLIRCYNCGQSGHMARNCPNPQQQQTRLMGAWNSGSDADRNELWRMMGGGAQAGGGVACIEEVLETTPSSQTTSHPNQSFQSGQ
ncbi:hypothetical protein AMATHDRAFT_165942 [Amanita thiersii Skay4041]|uniref:CCHC-type domain-containing protein n=1 Tax=Amanita thiersii Skay4041 TaxID=703135 RepID=A0A2A9N9I7_9AGAR|nr:hypothetical protein AMATHDRAFT_165942 [Amanita thiersii Skay4041]